ncbi:hypothetical protein Hanom_Chr01g00062341 [Helianthus anomalus]
MGPTRAAPAGGSFMPMFPLGLGQQFFYGQAQPTFIPPQPGFGHQYQLVLGMSPNMSNFYMPMVQHGLRPGGSRVGVHEQQQIQQQPVLHMQQQTMPYGPMSHHEPKSYPYDAGNVMQLSDTGQGRTYLRGRGRLRYRLALRR